MATASVPASSACVEIVRAATAHCSGTVHVIQPVPAAPPAFDPGGLIMALTGLSTAFIYGSIALAVLALIAGFAWGYVVRKEAVKEACIEAQQEAKKIAEELIQKWLAGEAPGVVREHVEFLEGVRMRGTASGTVSGTAQAARADEPNPADEIGEKAG